MAMAGQQLIRSLNLPSCLRDRILCRVPPLPKSVDVQKKEEQPNDDNSDLRSTPNVAGGSGREGKSFVLYLPTVLLRKRHNPAFALACRLANHYQVPLLVLVTVLDDAHLSRPPLAPLAMTSRRLAFCLEALQDSCCPDWESHGAGVVIRVHGPGCRIPHHQSLVHSAAAVVSDEPFVEPYRDYVRRVAKTCKAAAVPFWTVDGSTTVPPNSKLVRKPPSPQGGATSENHLQRMLDGDVSFAGAPSKAWRWEKQTDSVRKQHVYGAYRDRALEAPELEYKLPPNFFLCKGSETEAGESCNDATGERTNTIIDTPSLENVLRLLPSKWKDREEPSPGKRPWSVQELCNVTDCKAWALAWKGADSSVPPCRQTHGSASCARRRWQTFRTNGLKDYAKKRNGILNPHAVSRISCYLNLGILSIFDVLHDVWEAKAQRGYSAGCSKFLDEVVKWREGSYVHAFANPNYHTPEVLPVWAKRHLESVRSAAGASGGGGSSKAGYDYQELERAATRDETWNAMQEYLIDTGELHNNARMTWGKTVVHWQASRVSPGDSLWQLCCLNDRFALDGLSPPSYGGLLWCFGWQDKPASGNRVSEKWAHRYRTGPNGFLQAKEALLNSCGDASLSPEKSIMSLVTGTKQTVGDGGTSPTTFSPKAKKARRGGWDDFKKRSIESYFHSNDGTTGDAPRTIG